MISRLWFEYQRNLFTSFLRFFKFSFRGLAIIVCLKLNVGLNNKKWGWGGLIFWDGWGSPRPIYSSSLPPLGGGNILRTFWKFRGENWYFCKIFLFVTIFENIVA